VCRVCAREREKSPEAPKLAAKRQWLTVPLFAQIITDHSNGPAAQAAAATAKV